MLIGRWFLCGVSGYMRKGGEGAHWSMSLRVLAYGLVSAREVKGVVREGGALIG